MREDLLHYVLAISLGFMADFNPLDRIHGRTYIPGSPDEDLTGKKIPNHSINFFIIKNGIKTVIWHAPGRQGWDWRAADLFNGRYRNHRDYTSFVEALKNEK